MNVGALADLRLLEIMGVVVTLGHLWDGEMEHWINLRLPVQRHRRFLADVRRDGGCQNHNWKNSRWHPAVVQETTVGYQDFNRVPALY